MRKRTEFIDAGISIRIDVLYICKYQQDSQSGKDRQMADWQTDQWGVVVWWNDDSLWHYKSAIITDILDTAIISQSLVRRQHCEHAHATGDNIPLLSSFRNTF